MRNAKIEIEPITPTIGAVIRNLDLAQRLDEATVAEIRAALLAHHVIFFPDQAITPTQQTGFAEHFGEIDEPHPVFRPHPEEPRVMLIEQRGREGVYNDLWHTDVTYQQCPPMGSILHAQVLPPAGGDTLWASMCAAYDALSERMKSWLEGLIALHDFGYGYRDYLLGGADGKQRLRQIEDRYPTVEHPVVRTHPETSRKVLFVNRSFTAAIKGLPKLESDGLLRLLFEHCEAPAFQMRHRWRPRDLAMWDNRCTQHLAVADYHPHHRKMHRVTIRGERPFYAG